MDSLILSSQGTLKGLGQGKTGMAQGRSGGGSLFRTDPGRGLPSQAPATVVLECPQRMAVPQRQDAYPSPPALESSDLTFTEREHTSLYSTGETR